MGTLDNKRIELLNKKDSRKKVAFLTFSRSSKLK